MTRNKKIVISVISIVVVLIVLFSVIAVSINSSAASTMFAATNIDTTDIDYEANYSEEDSTQNLSKANHAGNGFVKVAETDSLELYYKKDHFLQNRKKETNYVRYNIAVYDKKSKQLWTALPDDKDIAFSKLTDNNIQKMQSLVSFDYYDIGKDNNKSYESNVMTEMMSSSDGEDFSDVQIDLGDDFDDFDDDSESQEEISNVTLSDIPNGIRFTYDLSNLSIKFAVDFKINGDNFDVTVPSDQIEEKLEEYAELKANRSTIAASVSAFSESLNNLKSLDAYKALEADARTQLNSAISATQDQVTSLVNQINLGSSTSEVVNDVESRLYELQSTLLSFEGFDGAMDSYFTTFDEIKSNLNIVESSSLCGLVSVTPLPYFGCATNAEDGYVFYPDGSGAISYFDVQHPEYASTFTQSVYSNYISDIATYLGWTDEDDEDSHETFTSVMMPVFGVKKGNAAFVGIIAEGDADASIYYAPYSTSTYMNSVNASFYMRITTQNTSSEGTVSTYIDSELVEQDRRMRYKFLFGDDADYSGMAVKYREHLEEFGLINKSALMDSESIPLFLSLYMGNLSSNKSATTSYAELTTYQQAQEILSDLKSKGVGTINTYLSGWSSAGYYDEFPDNKLKAESKLGGEDDLIALSEYAAQNNVNLSLEGQYIFGDEDYMTYNQKDIGTTKNYGNFTISTWGMYMFNPNVVFNAVLSAANKYSNYSVSGMMFMYEGSLVYDDYNSNASDRYSRKLTQRTFIELAKRLKNEGKTVSFEYPNIYMAQVADWFASVPSESNNLLITDESVPFMQIVLHGYIPYTGNAYNNMYDIDEQTLKYIEYGYLPFYVVTNDTPDITVNGTEFLTSSTYAEWSEDIVSTVEEYNNNFSDIWKYKITNHETLSNGLVCVTYENGIKVLINYSKKAKKYNKTNVDPVSYAVVK